MGECRPATEEMLLCAVATQSYSELPGLVAAYRESVEAEIRSLAPDDPRGPQTAQRAMGVLRSAYAQLRSGREALAAQLAEVAQVKRLLQQPAAAPWMLRIEA